MPPTSPRKLVKSPPAKQSLPRANTYQEIHILLLSWVADDIGVAPQLDLLARLFSSVYNVTSIASCFIPTEDSERFVRGVLGGFLGRWDGNCSEGDGNVKCERDAGEGNEGGQGEGGMGEVIWIDGYGRMVDIEGGRGKLKRKRRKMVQERRKLLLIYYSGHGEVSTREGGGLDWCAYKKKPGDNHDPPSFPWTPLQKRLEFTHSDTLLILDCCFSASSLSFSPSSFSCSSLAYPPPSKTNHYAESPHPVQVSTFELLASCCFSTSTPGLGPDSFFNFLVQELCSPALVKRGMREGGWAVGELHARLVCRAGRGGEGARCPVLVRVSSGSGLASGNCNGQSIVFGRLEEEGGEMGLSSSLCAAREILGVLEERYQGRVGEEEEEEGGAGDRERARSCEIGKRESVSCCEVRDCEREDSQRLLSERMSFDVSESGVIRLDSRESVMN